MECSVTYAVSHEKQSLKIHRVTLLCELFKFAGKMRSPKLPPGCCFCSCHGGAFSVKRGELGGSQAGRGWLTGRVRMDG